VIFARDSNAASMVAWSSLYGMMSCFIGLRI
jgi:hypothetical protein